jgi:cyclic pyranopterin phosphate synthase
MTTPLEDAFGRRIEYLRLSVTDRCDLRCFYCLPENFQDYEEPEHWLTLDEIERVVDLFGRMGTRRVRLTGGEPLVRRNLAELAGRIANLPGIEDLSLSTNATRLAREAMALKAAGVSRLNISLDTLQPERFREITKGRLDKVLDGIMAARHAGFAPIKINMVVMKGINDGEVEDMVDFCIEHEFTLRFIETMPVGDTGRIATDHYLDLNTVRKRLGRRFDLIPAVMQGGGPARYVEVVGSGVNIGFITPISRHFCETCNRVRLSVDGVLYLCLGHDDRLELRPLLRSGAADAEIEQAIRQAILRKPERHHFQQHPEQVVRFMAKTGG